MKIIINLFYAFTLIIFYIFIDEVLKLNYKPDYESYLREIKSNGNKLPVLVICFKLNLGRNNCDYLDEKLEFNCNLTHQIGCLTKGWNNIRRNWIKNEIKKCKLEQKFLIYDRTNKIRPKYELNKEEDKLCLKFDNKIFFNLYRSQYVYKFRKSFNQDFNIYFQTNKNELLKKSLFHRKCFLINQTNYNCRNARIGFNSAQIIRKKNLYATKCIDYGFDNGYENYLNHHECMNACFKKFKFHLTNHNKDNCSKYCPYSFCNWK